MSYGRCEGLVVGAHGECSSDVEDLIDRMVQRGAQRRFREMGFSSAQTAKSTVLAQVRLSIGIEAIRGMARVRLMNLDTILAGQSSARAAIHRRFNASARACEQRDAYSTRNAFREAS